MSKVQVVEITNLSTATSVEFKLQCLVQPEGVKSPVAVFLTFSQADHIERPNHTLLNVYNYDYSVQNDNRGKSMTQDAQALAAVAAVVADLLKTVDPDGILRDEEERVRSVCKLVSIHNQFADGLLTYPEYMLFSHQQINAVDGLSEELERLVELGVGDVASWAKSVGLKKF